MAIKNIFILFRRFETRLHSTEGQMTVEFVVAFPVLIIIAVIAVNALTFFSECASFDRLAKSAICAYGASPAYEQTTSQTAALVKADLEKSFEQEFLSCSVEVEGTGIGHTKYVAKLEYSPTLFGMGLKSSVFGVALPTIDHAVSFTVDTYKPGVLL